MHAATINLVGSRCGYSLRAGAIQSVASMQTILLGMIL